MNIGHFLQYFFDSIETEVVKNLPNIDTKVINSVASSTKDIFLKERLQDCEELSDNTTKLLCLSAHWSSFDYKIIKILIDKYVPKLKNKMDLYLKRFKSCDFETFAYCFKMESQELFDSEEELSIKLVYSGQKLEYIKKDLCKFLKVTLGIKILRLLKIQILNSCFLLTFGTSFQDSNFILSQMAGKKITQLAKFVTEIRLKNSCLYDLDGKFEITVP